MTLLKIVLPEGKNANIIAAAKRAEQDGICEPVLLTGDGALTQAAQMLAAGEVDGMAAGIDHTTRDVILATKNEVGMRADTKTFCSLFVMDFGEKREPLVLADGGVVPAPTVAQLADIALLTADAACTILADEPRVAMLSFSTLGSGDDKDLSLIKIREALKTVRAKNPTLKIDGEFQLDAAVSVEIGAKKAPDSPVAGRANILITPDLNSGNILYKSIEQFGQAHAYGPVLLGFNKPVSDLSRGSTEADVYGCLKIIAAQAKEKDEQNNN